MPYEVTYRRDPIKALRRIQPAKAADIREAVGRIAVDPSAPNNNVRPLKGVPHTGFGFASVIGGYPIPLIGMPR